MENHHNEEPKPTNKWVATPIVMAFLLISVVVFFITLGANNANCKDTKTKEQGTEHHDATNKEEHEHGEVKVDKMATDTNKVIADTTSAVEGNEGHGH